MSQQNTFPQVRDHSFAVPSIGHVANDLRVSLDESTSFLNGVFASTGLLASSAGPVVALTSPRRLQGRLRIGLSCSAPLALEHVAP